MGKLEVITPIETKPFSWDNPTEMAVAKSEFEARMASGAYFASVTDAPGRSTQVRTFDEIEAIEKERGVVEARIHPSIVGG